MSFNTTISREIDYDYCRASSSQRLANYVIDMIIFYLLMIVIGFMIGLVAPDLLFIFDNDLMSRLISLVFYGIMMSIIEGVSRGKSIGKLITKTKAVNLDGSEINFGKAFGRNIIRAIPFNALSGFGNPCNPWHDRLSDTMVIDQKKLDLQNQKSTLFSSFDK